MHPAVHTGHANRQRMVFRERANPVQGGNHRNAGALGQFTQLGDAARHLHAIARDNQRLLGIDQQIGRLANLARIAGGRRLVAGNIQLDVPVRNDPRLHRIFGDVDQHRARAASGGNMNRLFEHIGNLVDAFDQVIVLGDWHGDARDISFLKCISAKHCARNLASDRQHWRRVHHCIGNRRDQVGCAGAAGANAHAKPASRPCIAFRRVATALLVPHQHMAQLVAIFPHCVIERHDRAAREAKHHLNTITDQCFAHDLRTCSLLRHTPSCPKAIAKLADAANGPATSSTARSPHTHEAFQIGEAVLIAELRCSWSLVWPPHCQHWQKK